MKLVIPIFHTEFDALQVSTKVIGENPPSGDFGDFWWLFWLLSLADEATFLAKWGISIVHVVRYSLVLMVLLTLLLGQ